MNNAFKPTHKILFRVQGVTHKTDVMLVEDTKGKGGPAYSEEEWEASSRAAWELSDRGEWLCDGQPTPKGQLGDIEVVKYLEPKILPARLK